MNKEQWKSFCEYKKQLKSLIEEKNPVKDELAKIQQEIITKTGASYNLENSLVYNVSYDDFDENSEIKLIVVGDNPGWEEQLSKNQKYLVGQAGRIAEGYFRRNPELNIDFRKNVIITNKTPVHTAKTAQLKEFYKSGSEELKSYLDELQVKMAKITSELHQNLIRYKEENEKPCELWMIGYSELKEKGIFGLYRDELKKCYDKNNWENVFVFQHFSMNRFTIDLNNYINNGNKKDLETCIKELGKLHKEEIFKW